MTDDPLHLFLQGPLEVLNDERYKYDIIKGMAESIRTMADTQTRILERLARIEEQRVHEAVAALEARLVVLEIAEQQRAGAKGVTDGIRSWWPAIALLLLVVWTVGRAVGIFHLPDPSVKKEPAIVQREEPVEKPKPQHDPVQ